jgi:sugar/nucleoside kinase (ribokinase family)
MKNINCLGVAVMDALSGPIEAYPVPRLRPQITLEHCDLMPGGGAVNTASALARMGFPAAVFSKIGKDPMGSLLVKELERCGVKTQYLVVSAEDATPFTFVGVHPGGERTFIHSPGANKTLTLADLDIDALLDCEFLLYQDLWALPALDAGAGAELLASARRRGVVTLLDECWGFGPERGSFEKLVSCCDYVVPSFDDMLAIYPGATPGQIASHLLDLGAGTVVLKLGQSGCYIAEGKERTLIPALPVSIVDTTGAGDCWNAGFLAGLSQGKNVISSARLGCAAAAFSIEAAGGSTGVPMYAAVFLRAAQIEGVLEAALAEEPWPWNLERTPLVEPEPEST